MTQFIKDADLIDFIDGVMRSEVVRTFIVPMRIRVFQGSGAMFKVGSGAWRSSLFAALAAYRERIIADGEGKR